ncbi:MAG: Helix-turn-helix domain [Thermoleophilia bacterium]|jgi:excisionase family DNA binding protein|nr:Helix-turn-helix domain [Thermoleophilia bacterium]
MPIFDDDPGPHDALLYSVGEVAALMRCSPETVRRWCRKGRIQSFRMVSGGRLFVPASQFSGRHWALHHLLGVEGARLARTLDHTRRARAS